MFDFSHLSGKTKTKGESDNGNEPLKQDSDDIGYTAPANTAVVTMLQCLWRPKTTRFWPFVC